MTETQFATLALSGLLIISYIFSMIAGKTKFPSIILLLITGFAASSAGVLPVTINLRILNHLLHILGSIGLIFIILEAVIDIKIKPDNIHVIRKALASSTFLLVITTAAISTAIQLFFGCPFLQALIYAIPLSVVSSSVAIPSTEHLPKADRMLVIYETAFSDIIGVLAFNFLIAGDISFQGIGLLGVETVASIALSIVVSFGLIFVMTRIEEGAIYALILASLAFLYTLGKILHLPSLLLILVFGVLVNNRALIKNERLKTIYEHENYGKLVRNLKIVVIESTFVIRTIFFFLFGYSIDLSGFGEFFIWAVAAVLLMLMYGLRYLQLRLSKDALDPHLSLIPRGLVTVLLFYSIPDKYMLPEFNSQILIILILVTCLVMAFGLIRHARTPKIDDEPNGDDPLDQLHYLR